MTWSRVRRCWPSSKRGPRSASSHWCLSAEWRLTRCENWSSLRRSAAIWRSQWRPFQPGRSDVVIQVELVGVRTEPNRVDLLPLEPDPHLDQVGGEDATLEQVVVVLL